MKAVTARNVRPPRDSGKARALWRAAGMILLFNGLLAVWVLLDPYGERVSAIVLNAAGFVGPLLVLPLCFGGLLEWTRRRRTPGTDDQPAMRGQRWAPILLGMGILSYVLGQMGFTYYDWVLRQAHPLNEWFLLHTTVASWLLAASSAYSPNFRELRTGEVRGIPLLGTSVNKGLKKG
jgi:hypothetical protein